ncbi:MAG TPA: GNAT family protein [Terriglobia bacterium]|nr:GNAT family protein [Terriglobia bacterium]
MHHPFLIGEKVYLRAVERTDLTGPMFDWAHDPEVTEYMLMGFVPNTVEALEREFSVLTENGTAGLLQLPEHPSNIVLAIVDRRTDVHIGNIGLFGINWLMRVAEIRHVVGNRQYWGGGYGFESYRLILHYAFDRLNLRRIAAGTRADNVRTRTLMKKVGFVDEGCAREHYLRNEQAYDITMVGLLRRDFYALFPSEAREAAQEPSHQETEVECNAKG